MSVCYFKFQYFFLVWFPENLLPGFWHVKILLGKAPSLILASQSEVPWPILNFKAKWHLSFFSVKTSTSTYIFHFGPLPHVSRLSTTLVLEMKEDTLEWQ